MIRIGDPVALTVGVATVGHVRITPKVAPKSLLTDKQLAKLKRRA